jgi:hypothetical protein
MKIQKFLSEAQSFTTLLPMAQAAEVKLSMWGSVYVQVPGYGGTLQVADLAARVIKLIKHFEYEYTSNERENGKLLAGRIDSLYREQDRRWSEANYFTVAMGVIRGIFSVFSGLYKYCMWGTNSIRFDWEAELGDNGFNSSFRDYTTKQFEETFKLTPEEADKRGLIAHRLSGDPNLWGPSRKLLIKTDH